ncbi:MAG: hypothetical protein V3T83_08860 [Acidobacteriota bacterium]
MSWDNLIGWAGSKILRRGKAYQREGCVRQLGMSAEGQLLAWVYGSRRYAASVGLKEGKLVSDCSCPYEYSSVCKHAVAVVVEYLQHCKENRPVPSVADDDPRWPLIEEGDSWDEGDWDEIDEEDWDDVEVPEVPDGDSAPRQSGHDESLISYLEGHSKTDLVRLIEELARRFRDVESELKHRRQISTGTAGELIRSARQAIEAASSMAQSDPCSDYDESADYSQVQGYLETLLEQGQADAVIELGRELLEKGNRQVELMDEEGELGMEIAECMETVFKALPNSSLQPSSQILWAIEADMEDSYELCSGIEEFWAREFERADWEIVADRLREQIDQQPLPEGEADFNFLYRREGWIGWLIGALEEAGRDEEILPLCRQEAERFGSYDRLVKRLIGAKQLEEARQWILRGMAATRERSPGLASGLKNKLVEILESQGEWLRIASLKSQDFFASPSLQSYQALSEAAQRADMRSDVQRAAIQYLVKGRMPSQKRVNEADPAWPLPQPETPPPVRGPTGSAPFADVLTEIAIAEKRLDDALHWHERCRARGRSWGIGNLSLRVADAVADSHPQHAIEIWRQEAEREISKVNPRSYKVAAKSLRKVRQALLKNGQQKQWAECLAEIRSRHKRKTRLMAILDGLEQRPIIES